jgi:hypothetical protein
MTAPPQPDPLSTLSDPRTFRVERPVATPAWRVPVDLRLDGERLVWRQGESEAPWVEPSPGLLEDFVALREGSLEDVLSYARRWGVLHLCEHGFPAGHPALYWPGSAVEAHPCPFDSRGRLTAEARAWDAYRERLDKYEQRRDAYLVRHSSLDGLRERAPELPPVEDWPDRASDLHLCLPLGYRIDAPWEPVSGWRTWALRAWALLSVVAALRTGERVRIEDWRDAIGYYGVMIPEPASNSEFFDEAFALVNYWLGAAGVRPWLAPGNGGVGLALGSSPGNSPLFGAIAVQLALAVCGAEGFAVCYACKVLYAPPRKPRAGERSYCQQCRDAGVPVRQAVADYRARKRRTKGEKA